MTSETRTPTEQLDPPPLLSIKRVRELTTLSKATIWRRIADRTLEVASGTGNRRKCLVTRASIERFMQPRDEAAS